MPKLMAARSNIGGVVCESSVIPFLVPHRKVWLRPAAGVPCSNTANKAERKTWTQSEFARVKIPSVGQKPHKCIYSVPAKETTTDLVKFGWPPLNNVGAVTKPRREIGYNLLRCHKLVNRSQPSVRRISPYCEDIWTRYRCLTGFFPIVNTCLCCEDIARQSCAMVPCIFIYPRAARFRPAS